MTQVETVKFAAFTEATRDDFELIAAHDAENASLNADRAMEWLRSMDGPSPYQVSRLEHCLQSATRAKADGAHDAMIAVAQNCFDPSYRAEPLEHFEPLVRELFATEPDAHV